MKPTKEELNILRLYARLSHQEDKYVWLRQDEKGTYIEYAFKEGVPHDNRCLSWYFSLLIFSPLIKSLIVMSNSSHNEISIN